MASGDGSSLGAALVAALADAAGGTVGVLKSYTAKGWHAQISKLTSSPRGYAAAAKAGLSATPRTLRAWLSDPEHPIRRGDREKIAKAYAIMAGRWPAEVEGRSVKVTGEIQTGNDSRNRTVEVTAPASQWQRMRDKWEDGDVDVDDFEEIFVEDVWEDDLGDGSDGWGFPGASYAVVLG